MNTLSIGKSLNESTISARFFCNISLNPFVSKFLLSKYYWLMALLFIGIMPAQAYAVTPYKDGTANVIEFGADPTGSGDSTQAFKNAINALANSPGGYGGLLFVPPGRYKLSSQLTIPNRVDVKGAGSVKTILDFSTQTFGHGIYVEGGVKDYWFDQQFTFNLEGFTVKKAASAGVVIKGYPDASKARSSLMRSSIRDVASRDSRSGSGFFFQDVFMLELNQLWAADNKYFGFMFAGFHTTIAAQNLLAVRNGKSGFYLTNMTNSSFTACGSDGNKEWGYQIANTIGVTIASSSAEENGLSAINIVTSNAWANGASYYVIRDVKGVSINGFFALSNARDKPSLPQFLKIYGGDDRLIQGSADNWVSVNYPGTDNSPWSKAGSNLIFDTGSGTH